MIEVNWKGNMVFEAMPPSGKPFTMDAYSDTGEAVGPTPLEMFLGSLAACSAMDVIAILKKQRQEVTSYRIEVEGERAPYGSPWPRPYLSITVRHILQGVGLEEEKVQKAIELSGEKYCSVASTLRESPPIKSEWVVENSPATV